jgi:hypothetical protein
MTSAIAASSAEVGARSARPARVRARRRATPGAVAEIGRQAVGAQAGRQRGVAGRAVGIAPRDLGRVGEGGQEAVSVARLIEPHAVEQELDPDVGGGPARTTPDRPRGQAATGVAEQRQHHRRAVEDRVGGVVERHPSGHPRIALLVEPGPTHRREVGQHRAQGDPGVGWAVPARDRRVTEEVHAAW